MCTGWFFSRWRLWIRPVVMLSYALIILVLLPFFCVKLQKNGTSPQVQAWFTSGVFVMMALPITFWEITQHLVHYNKPYLQRYIIRILWMVPIYALNAWLALAFPKTGIYLDVLRECYEAYVIYNFMIFLLNFLYYEMDMTLILETRPPVKYIFPLCCFPPCPAGKYFIQACKHGILQYTVIRPITTLISLITEMCDVYGEGKFDPKYAYPYIVAINNISQFVAMYSLVLFYQANKNELAPMKPIAKFLCIKAVVFFSFFQSVIIAILTYVGVITESFTTPGADVAEVGRSLQNFLICIEMFMASVAHYYAFSHKPYVDMAAQQVPCCLSFMSMWDVSDVTQDVSDHLRHVGKTVKMSVSGRHLAMNEEEKQLLVPNHEMENPSASSTNYNTLGVNPPSRPKAKNSYYEEAEDLSHEVET
ncbi:transmembrane protein 184C [Parasteatoda tepidariorum]|uniref:transmembrane protein 184C n=1 Tax=Parasteatoda tepidariorum TaxID=114398 RepID=UPI000A2C0B13|nr:transmembrane protein 184C [Parasteatoda tepidariorum]